MEAIDTNILVRYITGDDATQLTKATHLIESGELKLVNPVVLVELSWVLMTVYKLSRDLVASALQEIGRACKPCFHV